MYGSDLKLVERSFVIKFCRKKRRDELCRLFAVILPRSFDRGFYPENNNIYNRCI